MNPNRGHNALDLTRLQGLADLEVALMRDFVGLLTREEALLIAGDADALLPLAEEKTAVYRKLQRISDQRALLLGAQGYTVTPDLLRQIYAQSPTLSQRWEEVLELAREAERRNTLNGKLINEKLQSNQAALNILMSATNQQQFYGSDGMSRASGLGRILGSA